MNKFFIFYSIIEFNYSLRDISKDIPSRKSLTTLYHPITSFKMKETHIYYITFIFTTNNE